MDQKLEYKILSETQKYWQNYKTKNNIDDNSCILAVNFAHKILSALDVPHVIVPIGTTVFNKDGYDHFGESASELPDSAWSVHCSTRSTGSGFSGHLVIETENYLLDLTALQFERKKHNIVVGESLIVPHGEMEVFVRDSNPCSINKLFGAHVVYKFSLSEGIYTYFEEEWNKVYTKSADWKVTYRELGIGKVLESIKRDLTL
jgi:hypothetical protein